MRYLVILIILATSLLSPLDSLAQSVQIEKKDFSKEPKQVDPEPYHWVRITLTNGLKVEGQWLTRREDAAVGIFEKGKLRWVAKSDLKAIKDQSNGKFWKKARKSLVYRRSWLRFL